MVRFKVDSYINRYLSLLAHKQKKCLLLEVFLFFFPSYFVSALERLYMLSYLHIEICGAVKRKRFQGQKILHGVFFAQTLPDFPLYSNIFGSWNDFYWTSLCPFSTKWYWNCGCRMPFSRVDLPLAAHPLTFLARSLRGCAGSRRSVTGSPDWSVASR